MAHPIIVNPNDETSTVAVAAAAAPSLMTPATVSNDNAIPSTTNPSTPEAAHVTTEVSTESSTLKANAEEDEVVSGENSIAGAIDETTANNEEQPQQQEQQENPVGDSQSVATNADANNSDNGSETTAAQERRLFWNFEIPPKAADNNNNNNNNNNNDDDDDDDDVDPLANFNSLNKKVKKHDEFYDETGYYTIRPNGSIRSARYKLLLNDARRGVRSLRSTTGSERSKGFNFGSYPYDESATMKPNFNFTSSRWNSLFINNANTGLKHFGDMQAALNVFTFGGSQQQQQPQQQQQLHQQQPGSSSSGNRNQASPRAMSGTMSGEVGTDGKLEGGLKITEEQAKAITEAFARMDFGINNRNDKASSSSKTPAAAAAAAAAEEELPISGEDFKNPNKSSDDNDNSHSSD